MSTTTTETYQGFQSILDPAFAITLYDQQSGAALNLTGINVATMAMTLNNINNNAVIHGTGSFSLVNAAAGQISYQWSANDVAFTGLYQAYVSGTLPNETNPRVWQLGLVELFPFPGGVPVFYSPAVYSVMAFGAKGDGTTDDTTAITSAFAALTSVGGGSLYFPQGKYLTKDLFFRNASNFTLHGDRGSIIYSSPASASSPGQATHDVCVIADCTDFAVDGLTFDGRRDVIAADQFLTANAASGQKNVTVQDGTKYVVGESVSVFGGLTANSGNEKTFNDSNLIISAINGNVLTLSANLTHSYTGTGASGGAWLTQYQTGGVVAYTIAGRSLGNEDAQNGLHLISCQRFSVRNCVFQNTWESPVKMGTGFATTAPTDGCSYGIVTGNMSKHGYDQGISVWNSQYITVDNNKCEDAGWAGISFSHCSDCTGSANVCVNNLYSPPFDLNEGTGIAIEGGVRVVVQGNVCSANNSNGIRLNISPMFGGAALSQGVSGSLSAGATSITLSGTNSAFVSGGSYTIVDPNNSMIRETIYCSAISGTALTISPGLRNAYASGPTIYGRFGEDVLVTGNICSLQALSAGIHADQQINLRVFSNDCSKNGFLNGAFADTQGTYGIHLHSFCQQAVVEANTCSYNAQEGIVIDNDNRAVVVQANSACNNGIKGIGQKMGIKLYGPVDTAVIGNECNFNTHTGIYLQTGNANPAHTSVSKNTCMYNNTSGIWLDNQGTTIAVQQNKIAYNGDTGIKVTGYQNCVFSGNQCYNQQGQEAIRFDDNGSNYCTGNVVADNELFDDQQSPTQSWAFRELNHTSGTLFTGNRFYGNTNAAQVSFAATTIARNNHDYNPVGPLTSPGIPASGTAIQNTFNEDALVFVTGGTVSAIAIGNSSGSQTATGATSGAIVLASQQWIKLTYSVAPTWTWFGQ